MDIMREISNILIGSLYDEKTLSKYKQHLSITVYKECHVLENIVRIIAFQFL